MKLAVETKAQEFDTMLRPGGAPLGEPLHWYLSMAGDSKVQTCPLSAGGETPIRPYRYDWIVGLSCSANPKRWWDWQAALRDEDALKVQVLIECPKGIAWSDLSAQLLALHPSRDTTSWFEQNAAATLRAAGSLAKIAGNTIPGLALGGEILNAIPSEDGKIFGLLQRKKYWFLYRYYDVEAECPALEWTISKSVIQQYGPLLRGSVVFAFHGEPVPENAQARLSLRAGLGFRKVSDLEYVRPGLGLEPALRLSLEFEQLT